MYCIIESILICFVFLLLKSDERLSIENMREDYYNQLRRHLEPENISIQSKTKSIAANSQQSASIRINSVTKTKQDLFRNQPPQDSFSLLDATALI